MKINPAAVKLNKNVNKEIFSSYYGVSLFFFSSRLYMKESFVDLYKVPSMRGVYIASQLEYGKVGTRPIHTKISYNKGGFWHDVKAPAKHSNGSMMNCFRKVRLWLKFLLYYSVSVNNAELFAKAFI